VQGFDLKEARRAVFTVKQYEQACLALFEHLLELSYESLLVPIETASQSFPNLDMSLDSICSLPIFFVTAGIMSVMFAFALSAEHPLLTFFFIANGDDFL
jgi:hypothetical protein